MTRSLAILAAFGLLASACATPTLPLPPPTALVSAPDAEGMVSVEGRVTADAYVFCLNADTDRGVIVRASPAGDYTLRIQAEIGHTLELWAEREARRSETVDLVVPSP
ncbi:MAG: hypothetical protein NZ898_04560 [Myxococcota bacterium]|nr:hypothetical protein [Myxococcota bacterium]MDW8362036.1 hypothetical protein [Myxococcales bacterium]